MSAGRPSILVLANPVAGRRDSAAAIRLVAAALERFLPVEVRLTRGPGEARDLAAALDPALCRLVVGVGGDGTLREIAEGLLGKPIPVGIVPRGAGNILALALGIPGGTAQAAAVLAGGRLRLLDVGLANGRAFLSVVGAGLDAEIVRAVTRRRQGHMYYSAYAWPIARILLGGAGPPLRVRADGRELGEGRLFIAANVPPYARLVILAPRADPGDGLLDAFLFRRGGLAHTFRYFLAALAGAPDAFADVACRQAARLTVTAPAPVAFQLDGDFAGELPLEIELRPRALAVVVPGPRGAPPGGRPPWLAPGDAL